MKTLKLNPRPNQYANLGFTLVELLLVLVILGLLAAIVYPSIAKHGLRARIASTRTQLETFRTALATFEIDNDHFPQGGGGLAELVKHPNNANNWRGPYLDKGYIPKDAWERDFIYICPGTHSPSSYDLSSMGPDGIAGTADDITSWQPANQ